MRKPLQFKCNKCNREYLRYESPCRDCGAIDSIIEINATKTGNSNLKVRRRWKKSERDIARSMVDIDGADPAYKGIASSTGKIGHITSMQADAISKTYVTEAKNRDLPVWIRDAWVQIQQRALDLNKNALLYIDPPTRTDFMINGTKHKSSALSIITKSRHDELILNEKALQYLLEHMNNDRLLSAVFEILRRKV